MQTEQQNQAAVVPEIAPEVDSTPIKKQHGGKRPGAGRKQKAESREAAA